MTDRALTEAGGVGGGGGGGEGALGIGPTPRWLKISISMETLDRFDNFGIPYLP